MDRTLKAVYIWIVLALIWMGLELLLYGEIQPRTVDDIMWFLFLPFIYMAVIKIGRAKMNTVQVTLSLYYEIVGADLYGGPESTGYAMVAFDFDTENLGSVNLPVMAEEWKAGFAKTCKVPVENITIISRCEYEDNTADLEDPDAVVEF